MIRPTAVIRGTGSQKFRAYWNPSTQQVVLQPGYGADLHETVPIGSAPSKYQMINKAHSIARYRIQYDAED
ncbi:hypothetical protein [Pontibacter sp. G13]|uniref:hypothetical protein n=1 Tax=Pontibacter sp. G13 TaxID=3074898 RepID=UPI00288B2000|nr:hypothetical protein [Pontibacter sp. G13]WNJ21406.1 hypothetical protein RJD25_13135 [Pontibacter sp. G13]